MANITPEEDWADIRARDETGRRINTMPEKSQAEIIEEAEARYQTSLRELRNFKKSK